MKNFLPIRREDAIKKVADYFNTHKFENVGIVFEKQKDANAFLDEVKGLVNKEDSEVWNKKQIDTVYIYKTDKSFIKIHSYKIDNEELNYLVS